MHRDKDGFIIMEFLYVNGKILSKVDKKYYIPKFEIGTRVIVKERISDSPFSIGDSVFINAILFNTTHIELELHGCSYECSYEQGGEKYVLLEKELDFINVEIEYLHKELDINYDAEN